ncbi:DUF6241 domain-containing protein [Bacillus sp. FSL W7-1360]
MSKYKIISFVSLIFLTFGAVGYFLLESSFHKTTEENNIQSSTEPNQKTTSSYKENNTAEVVISENTEPFIGTHSDDAVYSHQDIYNEVHWMTHQKVHSEDKHRSVEITPEHLERVYQEAKKVDDEMDELNVSIKKRLSFIIDSLEQWREGDFSNAVEVHNTIWEWLGSSADKKTGKALRLYTEEEEELFIEANFID